VARRGVLLARECAVTARTAVGSFSTTIAVVGMAGDLDCIPLRSAETNEEQVDLDWVMGILVRCDPRKVAKS
jgi:hypothetical protein